MTTKILDRSRPFGVVVGAKTGAVHYQDGTSFDGDDREIGAPPAAAPTPAPAAPPPVEPDPPADTGVSRADLEALHISQIKKLVVAAGLTYISGTGSKAKNIEQLLAG